MNVGLLSRRRSLVFLGAWSGGMARLFEEASEKFPFDLISLSLVPPLDGNWSLSSASLLCKCGEAYKFYLLLSLTSRKTSTAMSSMNLSAFLSFTLYFLRHKWASLSASIMCFSVSLRRSALWNRSHSLGVLITAYRIFNWRISFAFFTLTVLSSFSYEHSKFFWGLTTSSCCF